MKVLPPTTGGILQTRRSHIGSGEAVYIFIHERSGVIHSGFELSTEPV